MPVWKHVFMKAPLCESIGVPYVGRLLLESLSCVESAANLLGICSILQLAPVHCMAWCNISSLHGALPSGNICSSAKLTLANYGKLHGSCKIWDHICKLCCDVHGALKQKNLYTVECSQFLETKNYHLRSMCSILVQILVHRIVFAIFATIIGKPHGMRSILKLTSVNWMLFLRLYEAQTCKWTVFATYWNYHLQIAPCGMVFAACCG